MDKSTVWAPSLWLDIFDELVYDDNELDNEDQWTLNFNYSQTDKLTAKERKDGWKITCQHVNGRFQCDSCYRTWSSVKVVVVFRYRLRGSRGTVIMRPFRQMCRQCDSNRFNLPGFSDNAVEESLLRLFSKIWKNCYGVEEDSDDNSENNSNKYTTKPHEASLCEACSQGICKQVEECV
ncbi:hypothetical protein JOB18_026395 [Solea senegalensis]|uniref:3CxxC-type domain-containing protein n=1 Tax=Solea senegalensis TaxID=28829 RepID=A0AAV6R844_SOLSE|nr:receptor-transporting protein 3-like [Solea senegalensis]KAG7500689.1 hypothetical protein JOB18_026395 [Solea senegalensis]